MEYVLLGILYSCAAIFGLHFALIHLAPAAWHAWLVKRLVTQAAIPAPRVLRVRRAELCQVRRVWGVQMARYARARTAEPPITRTANQPPARDITAPIATPPLTAKQEIAVRNGLQRGMSANDLVVLLGGTRASRLEQIRAIRQELDAETLAASIAKPETQVPDYQPPPSGDTTTQRLRMTPTA